MRERPGDAAPEALVEAARAGDDAAFGALVERYQDRVVAAATSWLRDPELARDVAQEAFWNAHAALPQLDDPRAFAGWLRRIVRKHCDRVTRRGRLVPAPEAPEDTRSQDPDPEAALGARRAAERLRRAIEALPERERLPVALHYLARETQPRIAEFLELPLSTVKKRLRDARARLRDAALSLEAEGAHEPDGGSAMDTAMDPLRPSRDARFTDAVRFYLALRRGDRDEVARLLDRQPGLVEAEQRWDPALAHEGVLPFATRATPLITALERGDLPMARLLLERGASPDGTCGCPTGEPPLWAAAVLGSAEAVALLLEAGADPDRRAASGNAAIHVAALRGQREIAALLRAHGADPELRDGQGRRPAELAAQKGHELAEPADPASAAAAADPGGTPGFLASGIKAVDLLAPLPRGGLVQVRFAAGVGMVVLLSELSQRFAGAPRRAALWSGFAQRPYDPVDLRTELRESGLGGTVAVHVAGLDETPAARREACAAGVGAACALRDRGDDVLLVLLAETGFEADVSASLARLGEPHPQGSLTTLLVLPPGSPEVETGPLQAPFAARIGFDRRRAARILFPALDPGQCRSRALSPEGAGTRHCALAAEARALLAAYDALDPELALPPPETVAHPGADTARRAQRLLRYLSQPFLTTEPFTGRIARPLDVEALLDGVEAILRGADPAPADHELVKPTPGPR